MKTCVTLNLKVPYSGQIWLPRFINKYNIRWPWIDDVSNISTVTLHGVMDADKFEPLVKDMANMGIPSSWNRQIEFLV